MTPEERYRANERLVKAYAWRLHRVLGLELDDALALGALGLWQAVHVTNHPTWEAFARKRIHGAIHDGARLVYGRRPQKRPTRVSLDSIPELADERNYLPDRVSYTKLYRVLEQLDERDALILKRHFFEGMTWKEIATELGVSQPRVSFLKARALRQIRDVLVGPEEAAALSSSAARR